MYINNNKAQEEQPDELFQGCYNKNQNPNTVTRRE